MHLALRALTVAALSLGLLRAQAQTSRTLAFTDNPAIVKGFKNQGAYASGTSYSINDVVSGWFGVLHLAGECECGECSSQQPQPVGGFLGNGSSGGATGATGPQGSAGATGGTGATGSAGPQGVAGAIGPAGAQGIAGPGGASGAQGPAGPTGPQGPAGSAGSGGSSSVTTTTAYGATVPMASDGNNTAGYNAQFAVINNQPATSAGNLTQIQITVVSFVACGTIDFFVASNSSGMNFQVVHRFTVPVASTGVLACNAGTDFTAVPVAVGQYLGFYVTSANASAEFGQTAVPPAPCTSTGIPEPEQPSDTAPGEPPVCCTRSPPRRPSPAPLPPRPTPITASASASGGIRCASPTTTTAERLGKRSW